MLKKILFTSVLLVASMASQAAVIEYNGYSRDSASNIITGGGLEWLSWNDTKGMSINEALTLYTGWSLASNAQMASLYNTFQFGKNDWMDNEGVGQWNSFDWNDNETGASNYFIELFGYTSGPDPWVCTPLNPNNCRYQNDMYMFTQALFGGDGNQNGLYNIAQVLDDYRTLSNGIDYTTGGNAGLFSDDYDGDYLRTELGIALVRKINTTPSPVPVPSTLALLALGLFVLNHRNQKS